MFFLRIILVEGVLLSFYFDWRFGIYKCVHGCLRTSDKCGSHVCPIKTSAHVYEQAFCKCTRGVSANFCLNSVAVKFLGTTTLVVKIKFAAEAELNYSC